MPFGLSDYPDIFGGSPAKWEDLKMSLFDDVIVNVAAAVDAFGNKATEVVDRSRVRVSSAELKSKISAQFETLGRYVYDTNVTGTTDQSVVDQYVNDITVLINELKTLQDTLNAAGDRIICLKCCCSNSNDSLFCKRCGATLDFANSYTVPVPQPVNEAAAAQEPKESEVPAETAPSGGETSQADVPSENGSEEVSGN